MSMNEQIDMIIARKFSGEASEDDIRELDSWLAADSRNKAEYEQVARLWDQSNDLFSDIDFNTSAAWNKVAAQTIEKVTAPAKPKTIAFPAWGKFAIGAAAILLIGLFAVKQFTGNGGMEVAIADLGNKEVVLPDNTHVTLRKGSKLSYPATFAANQRNVSLEGEAFFEVTRNEKQPFVIDAQSVSVKVLGTSFNVKCTNAEANVTVATGKVQMTSKQNQSQYLILTKGEYGNLAQNKLTESTLDGTNYLFWKTGVLQYDNKSLRNIAGELSYYYQQQVQIDSSMTAAAQDQLINISFNKQNIEQVLNDLCLVAQCKWQLKDGQYIIQAK